LVVSSETIAMLGKTFEEDIEEMHSLAYIRYKKHQQLINRLREKVISIKDNKDRLGGNVDYETNLLIMEDANVSDGEIGSDESEADD